MSSMVGLVFGLLTTAPQAAFGADGARPTKRILLLYYSFGANFANAKSIRAKLEQQSTDRVEIYDAPFMMRPTDEIAVEAYAGYLGALFPDQRVDLAVTVGGGAVSLFQRYRVQLFPSTPMLAVAEARRIAPSAYRDDLFVASSIDFHGVVDGILRVLPDTKNVAVVIGNSSVERIWIEEARAAFQPFTNRVSFTWLNELGFDDILKTVSTLPEHSVIFFVLLLTDAAGSTHEETQVMSRLREVANAPLFSYYDGSFGSGIVGGPLISVEERSTLVADIAFRLLHGTPAADINIPRIGFARPKFDWREMQRWGIPETRLPPDSEIHFRNPSPWDQYRLQIIVTAITLLLQAALIAWLLYEHRRRRHAEITARNTMVELTQMNRLATAGQLSASIAHEVSQPLTAIVTNANAAQRLLAAKTPKIDEARRALKKIVVAGHRGGDIVQNLRAMFGRDTQKRTLVDMNKVVATVLTTMQIDFRRHAIELHTDFGNGLPPVHGNRVQLQQIVLNLIVNAIEAMHAKNYRMLRVTTHMTDQNLLHVSIEDSGSGIASADLEQIFKPLFSTKARGMGMGLSICQSIVESHRGRIWVTSSSTGGSNFQFELPADAPLK